MQDMELNPFEVLNAIEVPVTVGKKEYIGGRICFAMMFFLPATGDKSIPARLVAAEARVRQLFDLDRYEFWTAQEPYGPTGIAKQTPPDPAALLDVFQAENSTHVTGAFTFKLWRGMRDGKAPPTQMVSYFYERSHETEANADYDMAESFQVNMPLDVLEAMNQLQLLQKLFADLCDILSPMSAVGGLCMATPLSRGILQERQQALYPLLKNHPGLLAGHAFDLSVGSRFAMSAVNWLTAIDAGLLEKCGGAELVNAQLTLEGFHTKEFGEGGMMFQAGPSPQMGNLDEGLTLPHYGMLARALQPARLEFSGRMPHVIAYGPEGAIFDPEALEVHQNAWLARFDEM